MLSSDEDENESSSAANASSLEYSSLSPPPLISSVVANENDDNPLMKYFDEGDTMDAEGQIDDDDDNNSVRTATQQNEHEINDNNNSGEIIISVKDNKEQTSENNDTVNEADDQRGDEQVENAEGSLLSIDNVVDLNTNDGKNDTPKLNNDQIIPTNTNVTNERNSNSINSPSASPPTLPTTTNNDTNNNDNPNNNKKDLSPGSQAEAERQAAIAAAISANMNDSSPSAAGNIAKYMMNTKGAIVPPSPLVGEGGGTIVSLPPLSPPPPLAAAVVGGGGGARKRVQQKVMRPVRFKDVRVAFDVIMSENNNGRLTGGDEMIVSNNDHVKLIMEQDGHNGDDDSPSEKNVAVVVDNTAVEAGGASSSTTPSIIIDVETRTELETPVTSKTAATSSTLPDSFLRFLLLLANVPIIIQEGEKSPKRPTNKGGAPNDASSNPDTAVMDAAHRVYELYTLAQNAFDSISKRQLSQQNGRRGDATATFFAACSGELDDIIATTVDGSSVKESNDGRGATMGVGRVSTAVPVATNTNSVNQRHDNSAPPRTSSPLLSISTTSASAAVASASAVFSNVMSKVTKKQNSFSNIGKKFMSGSSSVLNNTVDRSQFSRQAIPNNGKANGGINNSTTQNEQEEMTMKDYEVTIDQEMLGLTVENVLERTIIRTLLPHGAAIHAGAKVGSLIAKVGNVDTSNLTHFETIDELRQSQRPLRLSLRYISSDILRSAREEMGRLIRGRIDPSSISDDDVDQREQSSEESFDSVLKKRWPMTSASGSSSPTSMIKMTSSPTPANIRADSLYQAGKELIRILTLLVVGMEKELLASVSEEDDDHLSTKELNEALEITSKILLEYARGHTHSEKEAKRGGAATSIGKQVGSSFYPVPPGRVQGKKQKGKIKGKKSADDSPLLRIGDALQRTRFFLVETSSTTATALRWEIIDYLCKVLDLDTEQELSEKEAASAMGGGDTSPINDLGSAGSILKLIVLNCSTLEDLNNYSMGDDSSLSLDDQSSRSGNISTAGNAFISVVHRLAASKSTSARITACSLGPVLWSHLDFPRQLQLRGVITRALHDVEVIVRKSTAAVLHEIAELVFDRRSVPWLVLMCERSMTDPEPQLRAAAMTLTWHLAEHLPNAFTGDANKGSLSIRRLPPRSDPTFMDVYLLQCKLLPVASNLAEDKIASVRLSVAAQCDRLVNAMGEHWFNIIIDLLQALLSDSDERVRSEATLCVPRFAEIVIIATEEGQDSTILESLMPLALKMQRDPSPLVRASLATASGELLIFLVGLGGASHDSPSSPQRKREGSEAPPSPRKEVINGDESGYKRYKKHVDDTFIPILQNLLKDPSPEVTTASLRAVTNASRSSARSSASTPSCSHNKFDAVDDDLVSVASMTSLHSHLSVDRTKPVFIPVLSENQVLRLLPTLSNLATSSQWRVRQSAVEIVPALLGCTHRHETRYEISKLCLTLMSDKVDAVRKTAAECLCLGGSNLARHGEDDGGQWITNIVLPHLQTCSRSEDAKQRMLSLKMIEIIITNGLCPTTRVDVVESRELSPISKNSKSEAASKESAVRSILSVAESLALDGVPNVRLNVGRVLVVTIGLLDRPNAEFAVSFLEKQIAEERNRETGTDRDVIYFAQQALSIFRQQPLLSELRRESSLLD